VIHHKINVVQEIIVVEPNDDYIFITFYNYF